MGTQPWPVSVNNIGQLLSSEPLVPKVCVSAAWRRPVSCCHRLPLLQQLCNRWTVSRPAILKAIVGSPLATAKCASSSGKGPAVCL